MARKKTDEEPAAAGENALKMIPSYVERIERLEEEKKLLSSDVKDVYGEAKGTGLNTKALRLLVGRRKKDKSQQAELEALLQTYEEQMS